MPEPGSKQMKSRMKKVYIGGGAWAGAVLSFLGGGILLRVLQDLTGQPFLHNVFWTAGYMVLALVVAPIIGAFLGYRLGKRNCFEKPKWAIWLDSHL
jgi:mannose/fructose/N-acetylgalactosamine-specific phosphotransferase system component IIC